MTLMNSKHNYDNDHAEQKKTPDHAQTDSRRLYDQLIEGLNDIALGNTRPFAEAMADVKVKRSK